MCKNQVWRHVFTPCNCDSDGGASPNLTSPQKGIAPAEQHPWKTLEDWPFPSSLFDCDATGGPSYGVPLWLYWTERPAAPCDIGGCTWWIKTMGLDPRLYPVQPGICNDFGAWTGWTKRVNTILVNPGKATMADG